MAQGINKAIIIGNLGNDPETRNFPDGGQVTNITVATSESWKDRQTGQPQERTEWHRVSFNGRLAEIAAQYLRKGSKVYIEGSLRTRKYQDKQTGQDRYSTDIVARQMQMLDSKSEGASQQQAPQQHPQAPQNNQTNGGYNNQQNQQQAPQPVNNMANTAQPMASDFDDDIPFSNYELKTLI